MWRRGEDMCRFKPSVPVSSQPVAFRTARTSSLTRTQRAAASKSPDFFKSCSACQQLRRGQHDSPQLCSVRLGAHAMIWAERRDFEFEASSQHNYHGWGIPAQGSGQVKCPQIRFRWTAPAQRMPGQAAMDLLCHQKMSQLLTLLCGLAVCDIRRRPQGAGIYKQRSASQPWEAFKSSHSISSSKPPYQNV